MSLDTPRALACLILAASSGACAREQGERSPAMAVEAPAKATPGPSPTTKPASGQPDWSKAFRHELRYDAAAKALVVDLELEPGYHAYAEGETIGRPLKLELSEKDSGYLADGPIAYPEGKERDLPLGKSVIVEGKSAITAKLKRNEATGSEDVVGTFHYQVCTEEACDRPRAAPFVVRASPAE